MRKGTANADENGEQSGGSWTGFYAGANGGLAQSNNTKDVSAFESKNSFTSKDIGLSNELAANPAGKNVQPDPLGIGIGSEFEKALTFDKAK